MNRDLQQLFQTALACHRRQDLAGAIAGYQGVLARQPNHAGALTNLAAALRQAGQPEQALALLQRALMLNEQEPQIWFNYANLLHARQQHDSAEHGYRRALELDPRLYQAHFNLGRLLHELDRVEEAESHYRQALKLQPNFARAHANLGNLLRRRGQVQAAVESHRKAIRLAPREAGNYVNLGNALLDLEDHAGAAEAYRRALKLAPGLASAALALARLEIAKGELAQAEAVLRRTLEAQPRDPELLRALAGLCQRGKRPDEAAALYRRALALDPKHAETCNNLGIALAEQGRVDEALRYFERALELDPEYADADANLGTLYRTLKRPPEAINQFRKALARQPDHAMARAGLAFVLLDTGQFGEALAILEPLVREQPAFYDGQMVLAYAFNQQARTEEALAALRRAQALQPDSTAALSNFLFAALYSDQHDAATITQWHRETAARIETLAGPRFPSRRIEGSGRPLRVGYLSPDLRSHPVAYFLEPILTHHRPDRVEAVCYSTTAVADATSARLRGLAHAWRDCFGWSDERLGRRIQEDGIDLLVELAGHTAQNRMALLARRPAPVQALYLGYPCTSGLTAIDYLIGDRWVSPPDKAHLYSERVVALDICFLCFQPHADAPPVAPAPVLENGYITFGCFNNLAKVSPTSIALWAEILKQIPHARLALKALSLNDPGTCERFWALFEAQGIDRGRIDLLPPSTPIARFLAEYRRIDIGLDPFPYHGGTTTCEALWMGVPVITLAGEHFYSRMGLSILENLGLQECIVGTPQGYVARAVELAADPQRLGELRAQLRERMRASPLCDGPGFVQRLEALYRTMTQAGKR